MTIINPNSIAGITSVTAEAGVMNFYKSDGTLAGLQLNGVNFNTTSGISTFNDVYVGGTITYEDVKNVDSVGIVTARDHIKITTDNKSLYLGASDDFQLFHNGSHNIIKSNNGNLYFQDSDYIEIGDPSGKVSIGCVPSGATNLRYNGNTKLATNNTGVTVTGTVAATSYTGDGSALTGVASTEFVHAQTLAVVGVSTLGSSSANNTTFINSSTAANSEATTLVVGHGSGNYAGMTFQCASNYPGAVYFTDTDTGKQGGMAYYHIGDELRLYAGETQKMALNSDGTTINNGSLFVADKITHNGDTNTHIRFPAADTITAETGGSERLRITSVGNVGMGTATPQASNNYKTFTISSGDGDGAQLALFGHGKNHYLWTDTSGLNFGAGYAGGGQLAFKTNGNNTRFHIAEGGDVVSTGPLFADSDLWMVDKLRHTGDTNTAIRFPSADTVTIETGGSERLRITSNGQLLSGLTTPYSNVLSNQTPKIQLESTTVGGSSIFLLRDGTDAGGPFLFLGHGRGGTTIVQDDDELGQITFVGADGTNFQNAAAIKSYVDGTPGSGTDMPGRLSFWTSPDNSTTMAERLRIDSSGNLGIARDNPSYRLHIHTAATNSTQVTGLSIANDASSSGVGAKINLGAGNGFDSTSAGISGWYDGTGTSLSLFTTASYASTGHVERLRINHLGVLQIRQTTNTNQGIEWYSSGGAKSASIGWGNGNANFEFKNFRQDSQSDGPYGNIDFFTGSTTSPPLVMRMQVTGEVGINTTNPTAKLHVRGGQNNVSAKFDNHIRIDSHTNGSTLVKGNGVTYVSGTGGASDGNWKDIFTNWRYSAGSFVAAIGDTTVKTMISGHFYVTAPNYGVVVWNEITNNNSWNSGVADMQIVTHNTSNYKLQIKHTSYYNTSNNFGYYIMFNFCL